MSTAWQTHTLAILDANHASVFDLLLFTLQRRLPIHSHHCEALRIRINDIMDLWSEQHPDKVKNWAIRAATETYHDELLHLIKPQAGFHLQGTQACLSQLENLVQAS
jgi:hypothetical protein